MKLETRYQKNDALKFEFIPEIDDDVEEETLVVKRKQFELEPMVAEEAILQMNLLGHQFYIFNDIDTNGICVVYKKKNNEYGIIEEDK